MPDFSDDFGGKYMNASHVTEPFEAMIERVERENVDGNGKMKPVVYLDGHDRGVVANATRYNTVSELAKSRNTDDWLGMRIAIRRGKTQFAGKTVDCVEFGAPKKSAATQKAELAADLNDSVPF